MLGYWVDKSPIKTNTKNIKSTIYSNQDKVLIAIGSWSAKDESVPLKIDWKALGIDKKSAGLISPEIKGLQNFNTFEIDNPITIEKNNGLILILETKK
jgi:hypothetical protein